MDENIKKLYDFYRENALLITKIRGAEQAYRKQLYGTAGNLVAEVSLDLRRLESYPEYYDTEIFQNGLFGIISSYQSEDYVLCADSLNHFIQGVMIPVQQAIFADLQDYLTGLYESYNQKSGGLIDFEETACGYATLLYHSDKPKYLCSTDDPMAEAYALAKENFDPKADAYHIWGMGLGYHVYALYEKTHGSTDIYVYDNDPILFDIARSGDLGSWQDDFNDPKIHLIHDNDITKFSASLLSENSKFIIHLPSLHKLPESTLPEKERKGILKKLQITINTFEEQRDDIYLNFYKNLRNSDGFAEDLFPEYEGQTVVLVAAGPSLDKNIHVLKEAMDNNAPIKVICVGTVLKKLIKAGITPDAFFEMDASKSAYVQIEGIEDLNVTHILDSSTYFGIAQNYKGKKYMACQTGFEPAERTGHKLFNTGSSVTTLALDFAIQAKAKRIILIGCDMAYTGDTSHAEGTVQRHNTLDNTTVPVKEYYGGTVKSSVQLSFFREWIENRIKDQDTKDIEIINATEGGAFIEGAKHISLKGSLSEI